MKKLILLTLSTLLFAQTALIQGLERGSNIEKRDACALAKKTAKENYDVKDIDVGCLCEKSDSREWMCFVHFMYLPKEPAGTN
ncbi:hypothetical protein KJ691_05110 [bacterium]|nr:hypothetical protein [bacterium]